jgi:Fatty acid hydroxylase
LTGKPPAGATQTMNWKLHAPLLKVLIATTIVYAATFALHMRGGEFHSLLSWRALVWIAAGALYTHLFEYFYHLQMMHRVLRIGRWRFYDTRHREHHRAFLGENFQTRRPEALAEVTTSWYTFPALFALHYAAFRMLFAAAWAPAFFLGVTVQFLIYEVSHWLTHLRDNAFDRWARGLPWLGEIRARQIEHHRTHHARPEVNFNFTPPYLGDRAGRTHAA